MRSYFKREDGASAVEYGLLVAGISAVIVLMVFTFGGVINDVFKGTCKSIQTGANPTSIVATCS